MNPKVKLTAYAVLLILAAWFGLSFRASYNEVTTAAEAESSEAATPAASPPAATNSDASAASTTNSATHITAQTTNVPGDATNGPSASSNAAPAETAPRSVAAKPPPKSAPVNVGAARGAMIGYLAGFLAVIIGLGTLIAVDVTQYIAGKASEYLYIDVGDAMRDPLYERAEAEWANASYLEAVQSLRDYLTQNPRELHAALRIAEIYEKDLKNYLAAALEYEEVLKHKLPQERWGWAAIHLCNLYSKLNHHDKTRELLQRIVDEYPKTGAAKKARTRLGLQELEAEDEPATEETVEPAAETHSPPAPDVEEEPEEPPPPEPLKPNLPPGFRPKK
jgi:TolA-binding protein